MVKMINIDFGILTAVPQEMAHYYDFCDRIEEINIGHVPYKLGHIHNKKIIMIPTGIGTTFAAAMMIHMHSHFKPKAIFYSGTSGGLSPKLTQGDIVIAESAYELEFLSVIDACKNTPYSKDNYLINAIKNQEQLTHYQADQSLLSSAIQLKQTLVNKVAHQIHVGDIVTINHFPFQPLAYQLSKQRNSTIVDLESSAIYSCGWLLNIPTLVIRGVSNIYENNGEKSNIETSKIHLASRNAAAFVCELLSGL